MKSKRRGFETGCYPDRDVEFLRNRQKDASLCELKSHSFHIEMSGNKKFRTYNQ
jgi:hypothetical protein